MNYMQYITFIIKYVSGLSMHNFEIYVYYNVKHNFKSKRVGIS